VLAGVFGGLGRATGTDPMLYRVLFGTLLVFGVVGGHWTVAALVTFLYGGAWLLLPEEGDEASALEAVLGRGHSSVSKTTTVVVLVGAVIALLSMLGDAVGLLALLAVGALVYVLVRTIFGPRAAAPVAAGSPGPDPAAATTVLSVSSPAEAYTVPFAPHGPYAETQRIPATPPPPPPPAPPRRRKPPRERSALGRITSSLVLLALGAVGLADLLVHGGIPASTYVATALGVVALGLLVGTVVGRARGLILLGLLLTIALAAGMAAERIHVPDGTDGDVVWRPTTAADLAPSYQHRFGKATLDLRSVPIKDPYATHVELGAGTLVVLLPPKADVTVDAEAGLAQLDILGRSKGGPGTLGLSDDGPDGPGGGSVYLTIQIGAGNVEVKR
jgi:phage shock protein PspC (stress-responsive transcriptional regulator)